MFGDCVLLGAGASKDAQVPTSLEMTWAIVDKLESESRGVESETVHAIYFALGGLMFGRGQKGQSPKDVDVEALFRAMQLLETREESELAPFIASWNEPRSVPSSGFRGRDLGNLVQGIALDENGPFFKGNQLYDSIKSIAHGTRLPYRQARERMVQALRSIVWVPDSSRWNYLLPLVEEAASNKNFTIATLNYDNGVEVAAQSQGEGISVGFDLDEPAITPEFPDDRPSLIKLHGSIDWLRGGRWPRDEGKFAEYSVTRVADPTVFQPTREHREFQPALIFGGGNKLRADGPFLDLMAQFRARLEKSDRLTVIGYSFRDDHVNHLIARWFNGADDREITIVDPGWKGTYGYSEERHFLLTLTTLVRNSGRVSVVEKPACEAIAEIPTWTEHRAG